MGLLVDGKWHDRWYDTSSTGGRFVRKDSAFRSWVSGNGSGDFPAESGRYHLYLSLACPWAHRTLIMRSLKGLDDAISISIVDPLMLDEGWTFSEGPGCIPDSVNGLSRLHEVYTAADPTYTGRVTVPILWDRRQETIVNNESSEILRMLNSEFNEYARRPDLDFSPDALREEIDAVNERVYHAVNNGVYRSGFATTQDAYDEAVTALFAELDRLEDHLGDRRFLVGDQITEADWRLFTTLIRFDAVYVGHFKCNLRRIADYPNLSAYTRDLYQVPGIAPTVDFGHITRHYYCSHPSINPTGIVPIGPELDLHSPHGRERLGERRPL